MEEPLVRAIGSKDETFSQFMENAVNRTNVCISTTTSFQYTYIPGLFPIIYPFKLNIDESCIIYQELGENSLDPRKTKTIHICSNWLQRKDGNQRSYIKECEDKGLHIADIAHSCVLFRNRVFTEFEKWCYGNSKYENLFDKSREYSYYKYNDDDFEKSFLLDEPKQSIIRFGIACDDNKTVVDIEPLVLNTITSYNLELYDIDEGITHFRLSASRPYHHNFDFTTYRKTETVIYVNNVSNMFKYRDLTNDEKSAFTLRIPGTLTTELENVDSEDTLYKFIESISTEMAKCKLKYCKLDIQKFKCSYLECTNAISLYCERNEFIINDDTLRMDDNDTYIRLDFTTSFSKKSLTFIIEAIDDGDSFLKITITAGEIAKVANEMFDKDILKKYKCIKAGENENKYMRKVKGKIMDHPIERLIQNDLCKRIGGRILKNGEFGKESIKSVGDTDVITDTSITEVKIYKDWKHALGQVLAYGLYDEDINKKKRQKVIHLYTGLKNAEAAYKNLEMIKEYCAKYDVLVTLELC